MPSAASTTAKNSGVKASKPDRKAWLARGRSPEAMERSVDADRGDDRRDHKEVHHRGHGRLRDARRVVVGPRDHLEPDALDHQVHRHHHRGRQHDEDPGVPEEDAEGVSKQLGYVARPRELDHATAPASSR